MKLVPIERNGHEGYILLMLLEPEDLARMAKNDPQITDPSRLGKHWRGMKITEIVVAAPPAEDLELIHRQLLAGDLGGALQLVMSGYTPDAKLADHEPYEQLLR